MRDPLHWPPGAPLAFAAAHRAFPSAQSATSYDIPAAYWVQALASLGTALAAFGIAALLAGAWAGVAAAALVGLYPPLILATGEQISEPLGAFWLTLAFLLFVVAARRGRTWLFAAGGARARGRGAHPRRPPAGAVRARPARRAVDLARGRRCAPRPRRRRLHPRRRRARDRPVERLRVRPRGRVRAGHARLGVRAVRRHLPPGQRHDGRDEALARRRGEAAQPEAARHPRLRPRGALGARGGRRRAIPTSTSTRRSRSRRDATSRATCATTRPATPG